ncbi:hypothetical protein V6N13_127241 [Hibiscus sabdariffa]
MASFLVSSLGFTSQKPCPFTSSLHFNFGAPSGSRFAAPFSVRFKSVKKRNGSIRVSVYSRGFPVVFRDLDADDSQHPLGGGLNELGRALLGLGSFIAQTLEEQLFRWLRAAELT